LTWAVVGPLALRSATELPSDVLLELTHDIRGALVDRGDFVPRGWVEEGAEELKAGELTGWFVGEPGQPRGMVLCRVRGLRAFGHVHLGSSGVDAPLAVHLMEATTAQLPPEVRRADFGVTGLPPEVEDSVSEQVGLLPGFHTILRHELARKVAEEEDRSLERPEGIRLYPVRSIPRRALADLDWRGFHDTPDEGLVADDVAGAERFLGQILDSQAGRFLDEASTTLVTEAGALVGLLLTAEQSPREAAFLDLVIEPAERRRRLGEYLLRWGIRALWALGYEVARLWVTEGNVAARSLYRKVGFATRRTARIYRFTRPGAAGTQPHSVR
jgi:ribosomal protein S18 acetylase RimI-like enzyme